MTDAEKGARIAELVKKQQAGKITAAELEELKKLLAEAAKSPTASIKPATQAEFDAARAKAAADETDRQRAEAARKAVAEGGQGPEAVAASAAVKPVAPADMKANPALLAPLGLAATPQGDIQAVPPPGQTGRENPKLYPAAAEPAPAPAPATAPAPAPAPVAQPTEPDARGYGDRTREFEEAMAAQPEATPTVADIPPSELPKAADAGKKSFGDQLKELYTKYGVPILEILEAVGYQRGGINKPTTLDKKYEERLKQEERDYAAKLEAEKAKQEEATYQKRIAEQRAWEAQQAELASIAEKEARGEELSSREKIAMMQLEASRGAARAGGASAPIIPD